jgi:hypothetical protein
LKAKKAHSRQILEAKSTKNDGSSERTIKGTKQITPRGAGVQHRKESHKRMKNLGRHQIQ